MGYGLGVDLGTTFTAAAVSRDGQTSVAPLSVEDLVAPSVVLAAADGSLYTGEAAEWRAIGDPMRVARGFKRRLGDPTPLIVGGSPFTPTVLMAALLRDVVARVSATQGEAPAHVVLTCPAVWGPYRRERFTEVPRLAGVTRVTLLSEPEAAAAHYVRERRLGEGEIIAVYDLGGGTFDTTVLRARPGGMEILGVPEGIERLGGIDFDDALMAHVDGRLDGAVGRLDPLDSAQGAALALLRRDCVQAKLALSDASEATIGAHLPGGRREVSVTRAEFEDMIRHSVGLTVEATHRTLASAGVAAADLGAVLLAGGSANIPLVAEMLAAEFQRPVRAGLHSKFTVALGAAATAGRLG
jgi:molecular chaperone DnaK (HSP70)